MPITVPEGLPAIETLQRENIFTITDQRAKSQDIRPMHILVLNLMPTKVATETQLLRLLSNSPLQSDVQFLQTATHQAKNISHEYLLRFYETFEQIKDNRYDGLIITGAPVERLPFAEVDYWPELVRILDWSRTNVWSTLYICWGAQAALHHFYGLEKHELPHKLTGIFEHRVDAPHHPLMRGFDDAFAAPHSRYTDIGRSDIEQVPELEILASSAEAGVYAVADDEHHSYYLTGHSEYDRDTLAGEYLRDIAAGDETPLPQHYFPDDDPHRQPLLTWRSQAQLLFSNWLNYVVYQGTPFEQVLPPL